MRYVHPLLGFVLELPDGWRAVSEVPPTFFPPGAADRSFAPNVVITSGEREPAAELVAALAGARLLDEEPGRTLLLHAERDVPTALEQWWVERGDRAWAISASCDPLDYDELADTFAAVAASFEAP
jgi:hypothetical protein